MQEALVVRRETHIPAPPAALFALLTDPEKILRWMGTEAQLEPQPGGLYLVNVTGARVARGSFREVVPVHRLAYSFGWEESEEVPPGSSLVEIDLIEQPDGTLLRLTHTGLPNAEQCAGHAEGWAHYLGRLGEVAAGRDPGPDPKYGDGLPRSISLAVSPLQFDGGRRLAGVSNPAPSRIKPYQGGARLDVTRDVVQIGAFERLVIFR